MERLAPGDDVERTAPMSTRGRRSGRILLSGGLVLAAVATVSACSSSAPQAADVTAHSSAVIQSSSAPAAPAPAPATSATGPATSAAAPKPAPSGAAPARAVTPSTPPPGAAAPVAVNGRSVPSCDPAQFARRAGIARGALQTYFFAPYAAGAMRGSDTKAALALLHAGQAVRFATQELVAAKGLLATCPRPVGGVVNAVAVEVSTLRDLWPVFGANHSPGSAAVSGARAAQTAVTRAALAARMPLVTVVPTAVQIQTGN
jgi:hypothetical protein